MAKAVRDPKTGRFRKRAKSRRRTNKPKARTRRRTTATRKAAPRRRTTYRSNPKRPDLIGMLTGGTMTAFQVLVGKAAVRTIPDMIGLPRAGNVGLATQAALAVVAGYLADMFLSRETSAAILAGGLTAPLETALVAYDVPWIGQALAPTTTANEVEALTGVGRYPNGMGRYPQPALVAGYPKGPLNRFAEVNSEGHNGYDAVGMY